MATALSGPLSDTGGCLISQRFVLAAVSRRPLQKPRMKSSGVRRSQLQRVSRIRSFHCRRINSPETGINLFLEVRKIRRLRKELRSRSNSDAVQCVIDERLALETGLQALRDLRKLGGLQDVFGRAPAKKR
jgi:hypothetical protein